MSLPEVLLWQVLRKRLQAGARFRRQHPVGPYILDFYCDAIRLAIEVDGAAHHQPEQARHDARRTDWLNRRGVHVHRIPASAVLANLDGVLDGIRELVREMERRTEPPPSPSATPPPEGED